MSANSNLQNKTILIVDSSATCIILLKEIFKYEKVKFQIAKTGKEAIRLLIKRNIDLILTELLLPDIDGLNLIQILKKIKPIPIIVISANCSQSQIYLARKSGCNGFVEKPIDIHQIFSMLTEYLNHNVETINY